MKGGIPINGEIEINLAQFLLSLSLCLDFSAQGLTGHHKRVAITSLKLAHAAGLNPRLLEEVYHSAIIHDIGAVSWRERTSIVQFDIANPWEHCINGFQLVNQSNLMGSAASVIYSHHDHWSGGNPSGLSGEDIPVTSRIIHLADRVDVLIKPGIYILEQRDRIMREIHLLAGQDFDPSLVDLFTEMADAESFWLDLVSPLIDNVLIPLIPYAEAVIRIDEMLDVARLFARVVDTKSPFTYRHSLNVSGATRILGTRAGLPANQCQLLEVAGLLHDLGKLAVPEAVLEKPAPLTREEFLQIKQHTYYTYHLLKPLTPSLPLAEWAAYHHERLDGSGYPFRLGSEHLDLNSRIIAVADVYTALREDRPYRRGLDWDTIGGILGKLVQDHALDREVVALLLSSREDLDQLWMNIS